MLTRIVFLQTFVLTLSLIFTELKAQATQAMYFLNFPKTVYSLGMGEQGVALRTSEGALVYNPANLVFVERPTISFFHQPFQMASNFFKRDFPLRSYSALFRLENIGSFGIEHVDWDLGKVKIATLDSPDGVEHNSYERSFSIGYAREFYENFSAGIQLRYAKSSFGWIPNVERLFVSAGLNYSPKFIGNKLNLGFSLTNFGNKVWYNDESQSDSPPSKLNLGIGFIPIENNYYSLQTQLAFSKPFDASPAESSFKGLFNDWKDFPSDATLHTGVAFNWKPLDLGYGFSFFQEFYIGNFSVGNKSGLNNFYTHGGKIGIEFSGLQFSAGYAGRWHNVHYSKYLPWLFPYETIQFSFGMSDNVLFRKEHVMDEAVKPRNILLSFGAGKSLRVGKLSEKSYPGLFGVSDGFKDGNVFFIESAFYINGQNAIVSNLSYNPTDYFIKFQGEKLGDYKVEIISLSSSYRYHPFDFLLPLYFQGGLAILRLNPTNPHFFPKYDYKTALLFSVGGNIEIYEGVVISPFVSYNLMLSRDGNTPPRMGGFNQFDLGFKAGYKF